MVKLLRNGSTDFHEILCAYRVGLGIGQHLFGISLNVKRPCRIVKLKLNI